MDRTYQIFMNALEVTWIKHEPRICIQLTDQLAEHPQFIDICHSLIPRDTNLGTREVRVDHGIMDGTHSSNLFSAAGSRVYLGNCSIHLNIFFSDFILSCWKGGMDLEKRTEFIFAVSL